jgi:hypothetical protein
MKPKSTIKKSQLESLVTMITKTLLNEIHNVSDKNNLFIEESLPDGSFNVVWRGTSGINDIEQALETLKTYQSNNRLELWSKAHAETSDGYAPMAYRKAGSNQIKISGTLKMLMGSPTPEISEESATSAVAPVNGQLPINKRVMENDDEEYLEEISCASSAGAYNIPAAFSKREGGSSAAMKGSKSLGYELTPQGKQDFNRKPDAMTE